MSIMFQSWRLKVREAEEAAKHGRLDEAARLLLDGNLREFLPGQRLAGRVASEICLRSRRAACEGNYGRAWSQYDLAQQLVGEGDVLQTTRRELIETAERKRLGCSNRTSPRRLSKLSSPCFDDRQPVRGCVKPRRSPGGFSRPRRWPIADVFRMRRASCPRRNDCGRNWRCWTNWNANIRIVRSRPRGCSNN